VSDVRERYRGLIAAGELRADDDQARAVEALANLELALEEQPAHGGFLSRLFGNKAEPARGIYMWGGVGRGKSMLMDLAYDATDVQPKRRIHFHEFMLDVHERLRVERTKESGDPVPPVAAALAEEARLLCFDEMVINNTADAMILSRLFSHLLDRGVTVITTSNRPPDDLYKHGLNRELFLPFIALIKQRLDVIGLNGPTDYRLERLAGMATWHVPNGPAATEALREAFFRLTDYPVEDAAAVPAIDLAVPGGRTLRVPKALKESPSSLQEACAGGARRQRLSRHRPQLPHRHPGRHPQARPENRNEAARFVTLIDAPYEHKVKLLAAATPAHELYVAGDGVFEFERTASRLSRCRAPTISPRSRRGLNVSFP
jgi:cell division protein ZapE